MLMVVVRSRSSARRRRLEDAAPVSFLHYCLPACRTGLVPFITSGGWRTRSAVDQRRIKNSPNPVPKERKRRQGRDKQLSKASWSMDSGTVVPVLAPTGSVDDGVRLHETL